MNKGCIVTTHNVTRRGKTCNILKKKLDYAQPESRLRNEWGG